MHPSSTVSALHRRCDSGAVVSHGGGAATGRRALDSKMIDPRCSAHDAGAAWSPHTPIAVNTVTYFKFTNGSEGVIDIPVSLVHADKWSAPLGAAKGWGRVSVCRVPALLMLPHCTSPARPAAVHRPSHASHLSSRLPALLATLCPRWVPAAAPFQVRWGCGGCARKLHTCHKGTPLPSSFSRLLRCSLTRCLPRLFFCRVYSQRCCHSLK